MEHSFSEGKPFNMTAAAVMALDDDTLCRLATKLDLTFGGLDDVAMRPMDDIEELFADTPVRELLSITNSSSFNDGDDYFRTGDDGNLWSTTTTIYARMLRVAAVQIANILASNDQTVVNEVIESVIG